MPIKLTVGVTRKIGDRNFGSRGASVGLEVVTDTSLEREPQQFHLHVRHLFELAQQCVDRQLELQRELSKNIHADESAAPHDKSRQLATARQQRALYALADRLGRDLAEELRERFQLENVADLSRFEASKLISSWVGLRSDAALDKNDRKHE